MPKKKTQEIIAEKKPIDISIEEIMPDRFGKYAKYIIQERAIPDVRDGLKPVQRRIVYIMNDENNIYNKPYKKVAKAVGNVMGRVHPHSNSGIETGLVNMSQWWKNNLILIDLQGNGGSIDGDASAASRYIESRLTKESKYLIDDLQYNTVNMVPNYDDTELEPTVLPAKLPFLLINGSSGIATGYATDIPPFNPLEVIDATIYLLTHDKVNSKKFLELIPAPDFPTGGEIMNSPSLLEALETGKGKIAVRAFCTINKTSKENQIIITEIPYEVVKQTMVAKMTEFALNNKDLGINEIRDESDKEGIRIVVDLKKNADPLKALRSLYKNTDLQVNYSVNMVSIIDGTPVVCGVRKCLEAFIEFRKDVVNKRAQYILNKSTERLEVVNGLIKANSIIDKIIKVIKASKDRSDVINNLQKKFSFTELQATYIADMRLHRLSNTDILALEKEKKELNDIIKENKKIINNEKEIKRVIVEEMKEIRKDLKDYKRRSRII